MEPEHTLRAEKWFALLWGVFIRVALVGLALYFLWRVRTILATVVIAMVLAFAVSALVEPLCHRSVPWLRRRTQRILVTTGVFLFVGFALFGAVDLMIQPFRSEYAQLVSNWRSQYRPRLVSEVTRVKAWYGELPPDLRRFVEEQKAQESLPTPTDWLAGMMANTLLWASHVIDLILIPVLAFYFVLDSRFLRNEFVALVPGGRVRETLAILREGSAIMRAYIVAQFWLALIAGVVVGVGLSLIGMKYALILGIFAGLTRAIPVIGPLIGGIPIVLLAFVYGATQDQPYLWVWVLVFFSLMHLIESKIIMPKFLGNRLHLHAAIILIVLLIGGEFFGLMGMFLAAPIAAMARILIKHYVILPRRKRPRLRLGIAGGGASGGERVLRFDAATTRKDNPS